MSPRSKAGRPQDVKFGNNIRELRVRLGMSEHALGVEIGVNQQQMSKYEKGTASFPIVRIGDLCAALSVGLSDLFREVFDNQPKKNADEPLSRDLWASRLAARLERLPSRHRQTVSRLIDELSALEPKKPSQQNETL